MEIKTRHLIITTRKLEKSLLRIGRKQSSVFSSVIGRHPASKKLERARNRTAEHFWNEIKKRVSCKSQIFDVFWKYDLFAVISETITLVDENRVFFFYPKMFYLFYMISGGIKRIQLLYVFISFGFFFPYTHISTVSFIFISYYK